MAKLFQVTETKIDSTTHLTPIVKLLGADHVHEVVSFGSGSLIRIGDNNNISKVTERVVTEDKASVLALMDGAQGSVKALSLLVLNDGGGDVDSTVKLIPVDYVLEVEADVSTPSNSIVTLINISSSKGKKYTVQETVANILTASNATSGGGGDLLSTNNLSDVADAGTSLTNLGGEPSFTKNTAFNKDFGTTAGTVLEGNTVIPVTVFTPTINSTNMVEVSQESDFGTAVGGVITLAANTAYFVRGNVNCTNRLDISNSNVAIVGWDRDVDGLTYTGVAGAGDFITVTDVNFQLASLKLSSTNNTAGDVVLRAVNYNQPDYNAGRNKVLTIINCQVRNCYDVWHIEGFDLVDIQNTLLWYVQASAMGCNFKNVSKLQISSCEYVRWFDETSLPTPSGYATVSMIELLDNGGGSGFGAVNISGCVIHPQQTQNGINIKSGATIGFGTIASNTGIDIGLTTGAVTSFDYNIQNSTIVQANQGIQNGNAKGILSLTDNTVLLDTSSQTPVGGLYSLPIADASFIGGAGPTNPITFPVAQRVITSSANGSFTYDSKIDGNFNVNLNATVGVNSNGTFEIQAQFRQNGTPLPLIGKTTIRNSGGTFVAQPIGLSIQGTATQGDVFDVLISVASANDVLVSELILNGFQF